MDRVQPGAEGSRTRNIEVGEALGALSPGWIVDANNPTRSAQRFASLDETQFAAFDASYSGSSLDVDIQPGEAFVDGWLGRDTVTTITLSASTASQRVALGWNPDAVYDSGVHATRDEADEVVIDLESNFDSDDPHVVIWEFDTDGSGVATALDHRNIGRTVDDVQVGQMSAKDGDRVDMSSDFFENVGHDDVEVPQVQNLITTSFETGVLTSDVYEGVETSLETNFQVQSSVSYDGGYALEGTTGSGGEKRNMGSINGLPSYPQAGDSFSFAVRHEDGDVQSRTSFGSQRLGDVVNVTGYELRVDMAGDAITLTEIDGPDYNPLDNGDVSLGEYIGEWVVWHVNWGLDGHIQAVLTDSGGRVLGSVSGTSTIVTDGGVIFGTYGSTSETHTIYWDDWTISRRVGEYQTRTQKSVTEVGNEVTPSGAIHTGPSEVPENHPNYPIVNLPVTDDLAQGEQVGYHLSINERKVVAVEAEADGNGGIQNQTLRDGVTGAPLKSDIVDDFDNGLSHYDIGGMEGLQTVSSTLKDGDMAEMTLGTDEFAGGVVSSGIWTERGYIYSIWIKDNVGGGGTSIAPSMIIGSTRDRDFYSTRVRSSGCSLRVRENGTFSNVGTQFDPGNIDDQWVQAELKFGFDGELVYTLYDIDGNELGSASGVDTTYDSGFFGIRTGSDGGTAQWDFATRRPI